MAGNKGARKAAGCSHDRKNSGDEGASAEAAEIVRAKEETWAWKDIFYALAETAPAAICVLRDDRFVYINPAVERMSGYTKKNISQYRLRDIIPGEYRDLLRARAESRKQGLPVPSSYEMQYINKNGELRWINLTLGDIGIGGTPMYFVTAYDITEHRLAKNASCESEERLQLCAATAHMGTFDWDILNDRHVWSPETYEIYGVSPDTRLSLDYMAQFIYPGDQKDAVLMAGLDPAGPGEYSMEYRIIRGMDQAIRWVYINTRVFFKGEGPDRKAVRVLGAIQDITERKLAEEALSDAKDQAELYLDLMGHDINNMHQIALGYLELARDTGQDAGQHEYLDKSIEVLQRSARLIKNVRKLQRLREGGLCKGVMDLCLVLTESWREYGALPAIHATLNLNGLERGNVMADDLLYDVFSNLLINAIKHTGDRANILVTLEKVADHGVYYYHVSVEDDGPGIPDHLKEVIFNRMLSGEEKSKGRGLGLYLVRSLVDSYNGQVWVEDRVPGDHTRGAKFVVILPAADKGSCD